VKQLQRMKVQKKQQVLPPCKLETTPKVSKLLDDIKYTMARSCRYTGLCDFGKNGEIGLDIEITHDIDDTGVFYGIRYSQEGGGKIAGQGRIWIDPMWNGVQWTSGVRYRWEDESDSVTTILEFNSVDHQIDIAHSFYNGKCIRYPSELDPDNPNTKYIAHVGNFDFICTSSRRREIRRPGINAMEFIESAKYDDNDDENDEQQNLPLYVRRLSYYSTVGNKNHKGSLHDALFGKNCSNIKNGTSVTNNETTKNSN